MYPVADEAIMIIPRAPPDGCRREIPRADHGVGEEIVSLSPGQAGMGTDDHSSDGPNGKRDRIEKPERNAIRFDIREMRLTLPPPAGII